MKASADILITCFVALALAVAGCSAHKASSVSAPTSGGTVAQHAAATDQWHGFPPPPPALAKQIEQHQAAMGHPMAASGPAGNGPH